jgi:hypothetical protein
MIGLYALLLNARHWARPGETIVRIRIPEAHLGDMRSNREDYSCYPDEIPAAWLEVVRDDEVDWSPSGQ